jgi:hypothetical protein
MLCSQLNEHEPPRSRVLNLTHDSGGLTFQDGSFPVGVFVEDGNGGRLRLQGGFPGVSRARGPEEGGNWGEKRGLPLIFRYGV